MDHMCDGNPSVDLYSCIIILGPKLCFDILLTHSMPRGCAINSEDTATHHNNIYARALQVAT